MMVLLDTDHLSILTNRQAAKHEKLLEKLEASAEEFALPIVAIEEQCRGWLARIRREPDIRDQIFPYRRFEGLLQIIEGRAIAGIDSRVADKFKELRKQKIRIGSQDLKIAAIAIARDSLLLSANLRDFKQVPGLRVENWLADIE